MSLETWWNWWNGQNSKNWTVLKSDDLLKSLQTWESYSLKEELVWKEDLLVNELKDHCTKIETGKVLVKKNWKFTIKNVKNKEDLLSWLQWKIVHIRIPAVWNFKWFDFDFFVSESDIWIDRFDFDNQKCDKVAYSMEDFSKILDAIRGFLSEYWVNIDQDMDYNTDLREREEKKRGCKSGDALRKIIWLKDGVYRLSDEDEDGNRIRLSSFTGNSFHFQRTKKDYASGNIISKL